MGFNKLAAKNERQQRSQGKKEFVPTTPKELRQIEKRARKADAERNVEKSERKQKNKSKGPSDPLEIRQALMYNKPVKVYKSALFEQFIEECKEKDLIPPSYREYEKRSVADAMFMFGLQKCLGRMNWGQLARIIDAAVGKPIPISSFTEAFHHALHLLVRAFDVKRYLEEEFNHKKYVEEGKFPKNTVVINDVDALDEWPIPARKRRSKQDEDIDMFDYENDRKLRASAADEDEDDDDVTDEDGDEDEDEDEDEKPRRSKAKAKSKSSSSKRKSKSSDDDDDEDEDDEPPRRGKRKAKDDDEDEDDEPPRKRKATRKSRDEDEDDDEDEKPRKRKSKSSDDDDDEDEPKRTRREKVEITDRTVIAKVRDREKGGPKGKLMDLIPKKGISVKELTANAKEDGLPVNKIKAFLADLLKWDYVKVK